MNAPYYQPPQQPQHVARHNRRVRTLRRVSYTVGGFCALIIAIAVIASAASGGHTPSAGTGGASPAASSPAPGQRPAAPRHHATAARVLATFTGSGIQNTPKFRIGGNGTWKLDWSYSCAAFGSSGNFIVDDGNTDANGPNVNELGKGGKGGTWAYSDGGMHYLSVNSECSWRVRVIGRP